LKPCSFAAEMLKLEEKQISLRNRLLIGIGVMFVPLIALAGGSAYLFESGITAFERAENQRLEEVFPLARLENFLTQTKEFVKHSERLDSDSRNVRFRQLSQSIDESLTTLLSSPTQIQEKRTFLMTIQRQWIVTQRETELLIISQKNPTAGSQEAQIDKIEDNIMETVSNIHQLNYLLSHYQSSANLEQAKLIRVGVRFFSAGSFGLGFLIVAGSGWQLSRLILRPLHTLKTGMVQFGEGDLTHRIELVTHDELEQLATSFNLMAEKLEETQTSLRTLATMDGLTGVYNRREFNRWITAELERSRRESDPVSLIMVDIDYFKKINDTYGHHMGDEALRCVSGILKQEVRPGDHVARYGGEEFAIILPKASGTEALAVSERLRASIEAQPVLLDTGKLLNLTASIGFATFPTHANSEHVLMTEADKALYNAKQSGRNRVCAPMALGNVVA
jgi:two-component system, cell cycle response regulator